MRREKHWSVEYKMEVMKNGKHKCNDKCRRLIVSVNLSPKEIATLWKLAVDRPVKVSDVLKQKLHSTLTKNEKFKYLYFNSL